LNYLAKHSTLLLSM